MCLPVAPLLLLSSLARAVDTEQLGDTDNGQATRAGVSK